MRRANGEGSIYKFRNGYAAYAWIITPEGRRQRKYVYGKTREVVHDKWVELTREAKRGPRPATVPLLGQFIDRWLDETITELAPSTRANYELFARCYIRPALGKKRLDRLSVRDVQLWRNDLTKVCQCCAQGKDAKRKTPRCCAVGSCCAQIPSEWTRHQAWTVLRAILSAAVREDLIAKNVAALVRVPTPRKRRTTLWNVDQARSFLESAHDDRDPLYAAYVLLLVLGLRRGEVLGLAWRDVDLVAGEVWVGHQLQRVSGELMLRDTKTAASDAAMPLPEICVRALELHKLQQEEARLESAAWHESGLVFTSAVGTPVDPRNFHRYFVRRCELAGVPRTPVHSTRRACASLLVALDVNPRVVMQILRHSQIAVTMEVYTTVTSKSTKDALSRLGSSLDITEGA